MAASGISVALTNGSTPLSFAGPPGTPTNCERFKNKLSAKFDEFARKIKPKFPDFAVFAATMTGLLIMRDAVNSVQVMQDWTSCRQKLADLQQKLERLLNTIEPHSQDPGYMNVTVVGFKGHVLTSLWVCVFRWHHQAIILAEQALVSGNFAQQNIVLPERYDEIIPTLESLHKGNSLIQKVLVKMERRDGGLVDHAPVESLHATTHQGAYNDAPVETKQYFGGPEDQLLENVKELVEHYQTFGNNADLPQFCGGSVDRLPDGGLCAYLVFSPVDGKPWIDVARAKQSAELCTPAGAIRQ